MSSLLDRVREQKAKLEQRLSRKGGTRTIFWNPKAGKNKVRIMPSWEAADDSGEDKPFWREVAQHWNLSLNQKGPVLCPRQTPGVDEDDRPVCPVCDLVDELKGQKTDLAAQDLVSKIKAKVTYLLNVIDLADPSYTANDVAEFTKENPDRDCPFEVGDVKVKTYACPVTVFDQILGIMAANGDDITHASDGRNIIIEKFPNKDAKLTRYQIVPELKTSQISVPENLPDLSKVGQVFDSKKLLELLASGPAGDYQLGSGSKPALPAVTAKPKAKMEQRQPLQVDDLEAEMRRALDEE